MSGLSAKSSAARAGRRPGSPPLQRISIPDDPAQFRETLLQDANHRLHVGVALGEVRQYTDPPHSLGLLRARRERPRDRRAADLRPLDLEDLIDVGYALEISLRLWSRMAQLALSTKYVTVEACNPPASARGNIEITDSGLDVR
jgi:hypothetical protein